MGRTAAAPEAKYQRMLGRVGKGFYKKFIDRVRVSVVNKTTHMLPPEAELEWKTPIETARFRIRAMASAVRQRYDFDPD